MSNDFSIENLIAIIRKFHSIPTKKAIFPHTLIEGDLGITGDDGSELLEHLEKVFGIKFDLSDFNLKEGEYLFEPEGFNFFSATFKVISGEVHHVKDISVNGLHQAIVLAINRKNATAL